MKTNKKLMLAVTISLLAMQPYNVFAANADDFRTDEYSGIGENVFDLINAADAYAQGYTGKGVTVGVTDIVANFKHPEFAGKENNVIVYDPMNGNYGSLSFQNLAHGTHVSGIIAANKDGYGMHGVAYDAGIASSSLAQYYFPVQSIDETPSYIPSEKIYDYYLTNPDIKIINNSWGAPLYVYSIKNDDDFINFKTEAENHIEAKYTIKPVAKAVNSDKLLIFGAGNSGHLTAGLENNLDVLYGDKAFNDNIITVTAAKANSFIKKDGVFEVKSDAIAVFSDLAMYNEDTALSAPGYDIYSANADFENPKGDGKYVYMSGTSMAAPVVTGVGALVQQAFPYLGGKQIGDVLLSTANDNISAKDNSFVTIQEDYFYNDSGEQESSLTLNVLITGEESVLDSESDYIKGWSELYRYLKNNKETVSTWFFGSNGWNKLFGENGTIQSAEKLKEKFEELFGATNIKIYENVPLDVIFGQGIVDAGNAVNGLGAINVRRLDSSDRSSDYTVAGIEGKTEQALYKVDTQGYNSVWSNDISEIRAGYIAENPLENDASAKPDDTDNSGYDADSEEFAGLTDLHDRWVFYTTNNFDNNPVGSAEHNWMTNYYIKQYNQQVTESGLLGLHAGLYKTGEGILALTGNNTYKGASIAAGGTLQIDGSVAGDAYSEGEGTISGSGEIKCSLYNYGAVAAGSWGVVTDKDGNSLDLQVGGDLTGSGVIAVNTNGEKYATINVDGTADVSEMNLKAGIFAAPGVNGTILTSDKAINGVDNLNTDFSGLLNGEVEQNVNAKNELTLTTSASNNAGINSDRFNAINSLYSGLSKEERQEMYRLYALDNNEVQETVQQLGASEGLHLEMAHDAMQNRDVRQAVARQQHLDRDEGFWTISGKSWGEADGGITRHSFNMTLGGDFYNNDDSYLGAMFAYSDNSIGGYGADGEYDNYSFGLYAGTKNNPGTVTGYLSYGVQDNEMTRYLSGAFSHSGLGSKAESNYDSSVIGAGVKYAYDLDYGKEDVWHISPYAALDYAHYKQDSFSERGNVFGVHSGVFSDNYLTGELGFDFNREEDNGKYGISLAYRRILDGDVQNTDFTFAKGSSGFGVQSAGESKNHVVASAYISSRLSDKWEIGGSLEHDWSSDRRGLTAAVNLNYYF